MRLVDAGFVWTEPHSKRIKVKLTIQKEVHIYFSIYYKIFPYLLQQITDRGNCGSRIDDLAINIFGIRPSTTVEIIEF